MITNALANLGRIFSGQGTPLPTQKLSILLPSLINMFQLLNQNIYSIRADVSADDDDVMSLAYMLGEAANPSSAHLGKSNDNLKVTMLSQCIRDDGSGITYVEYTHIDPDKGNENFVCLVIYSLEHHVGKPPEMSVHFSFSGSLKPDGDTFAVVIDHMQCLKDEAEMEYLGADSVPECLRSLAYANQAFLQLLMEQKLNCSLNSEWFQKPIKAGEVVSSIRQRTASSLAKTIERFATLQSQAAPETHKPQDPT
jgi:hypothetical protein